MLWMALHFAVRKGRNGRNGRGSQLRGESWDGQLSLGEWKAMV